MIPNKWGIVLCLTMTLSACTKKEAPQNEEKQQAAPTIANADNSVNADTPAAPSTASAESSKEAAGTPAPFDFGLVDTPCTESDETKSGSGWYCLQSGEHVCLNEQGCTFQSQKYKSGDRIGTSSRAQKQWKPEETQTLPTNDIRNVACTPSPTPLKDQCWICNAERCPLEDGAKLTIPKNAKVWYEPGNPKSGVYCGTEKWQVESSLGPSCYQLAPNCIKKEHVLADYACQNDKWMCNNQDGCGALTYGTYVHTHMIAENHVWVKPGDPLYINYGPKTPTSKTTCADGMCKCGNHFCGKNQECFNDNCWFMGLNLNNFSEFVFDSALYDEEMWGLKTYVLRIWCDKKGGCWTNTGIHYPQNAAIIENDDLAHDDSGAAKSSYAMIARKDKIKPLRESQANATQFFCDATQCTCGEQTCRGGQICNEGICQDMTCQVPSNAKTSEAWLLTEAAWREHVENGQWDFDADEEPDESESEGFVKQSVYKDPSYASLKKSPALDSLYELKQFFSNSVEASPCELCSFNEAMLSRKSAFAPSESEYRNETYLAQGQHQEICYDAQWRGLDSKQYRCFTNYSVEYSKGYETSEPGNSWHGTVRCAELTGCDCGSSKCPFNSECRNGHCYFDNAYEHEMCSGDHSLMTKEPGTPAEHVSEVGLCLCAGTVMAPKFSIKAHQLNDVSDFIESETDEDTIPTPNNNQQPWICSRYGWQCQSDSECTCGDILCKKGGICVRPGVCSDPINSNN